MSVNRQEKMRSLRERAEARQVNTVRERTPFEGAVFSSFDECLRTTHSANLLDVRHLLHFDVAELATVKNGKQLCDLLIRPAYIVSGLDQNHPTIQMACRILEAIIAEANKQLPPHCALTLEYLIEAGRVRATTTRIPE